jgi:hypothetical protein
MNCCDSFGNCTQGRDCPVRKARELDRSLFWDVLENVLTLATIVGIVVSLCFMFGYIWYRVTL